MQSTETKLQSQIEEILRLRAETKATRAIFLSIIKQGFGHALEIPADKRDEFALAKQQGLFDKWDQVDWDNPRLQPVRAAIDAFESFENSLGYEEMQHLKIDTASDIFWREHGDF